MKIFTAVIIAGIFFCQTAYAEHECKNQFEDMPQLDVIEILLTANMKAYRMGFEDAKKGESLNSVLEQKAKELTILEYAMEAVNRRAKLGLPPCNAKN